MHLPLTEELSSLNRDQLQKLLQHAVHLDPAGVLGKVFQHIGQLQSFGVLAVPNIADFSIWLNANN